VRHSSARCRGFPPQARIKGNSWHGADDGQFGGGDVGAAQLRTRATRTRDIFGRGGEGGRAGTADMHRDLSYVQPLVRPFPSLLSSLLRARPPGPGRCKTVQQLQDHHIRYYLARNHPIAICVRLFIFSHTHFPF
jgi:hypothetical protein